MTNAVRTALAVAGTLVLALSGFGCSKPGAAAGQAVRETPVTPVVVASAEKRDVPVQIRAIARVEAYATVTVRPQVGGQVVGVHFSEGQEVKADDLLFSIDSRPYEAALRQAQANLARDTALAKDAEEEAAWKADLMRQNAAAQREYDSSRAHAESLRATVDADLAAVERAELDLAYCTIRSPLAGRTGSLLVHAGNIVEANKTALVDINQIHPIYVAFAVPEQHLSAVKQEQAGGPLLVEAFIPNEDAPPARGTLTFIDNQVDRSTGTITLKGTFENEPRRLWPGQFVTAVLTLRMLPDAVVVPTAALQTGQAGQFVFVVRDDQTVEMRPVVAGMAVGGDTVVDQGLSADETVVIDGQLRLVGGSKVSIREQRPGSGATAQQGAETAGQPGGEVSGA
jgi:multidrug efflux system membrane fusion protein